MTQPTDDEYLTAPQAAAYLGIGIGRMYEWRKNGRGPVSWKVGRDLVYPRSGLDLYRAREKERTMRGDVVHA